MTDRCFIDESAAAVVVRKLPAAIFENPVIAAALAHRVEPAGGGWAMTGSKICCDCKRPNLDQIAVIQCAVDLERRIVVDSLKLRASVGRKRRLWRCLSAGRSWGSGRWIHTARSAARALHVRDFRKARHDLCAALALEVGGATGLIAMVVIQQDCFDVRQLETELLDIFFDVLLATFEAGTEENVTLRRCQKVRLAVRHADEIKIPHNLERFCRRGKRSNLLSYLKGEFRQLEPSSSIGCRERRLGVVF